MRAPNGYAAVDYLAVVAVVAIVLAGLTALRPRHVGTDAPVDVLPPIIRLLGHPARALAPPPRPARPRNRLPARPRPRPTPPPRDRSAIVPLPEWWRP